MLENQRLRFRACVRVARLWSVRIGLLFHGHESLAKREESLFQGTSQTLSPGGHDHADCATVACIDML